RFWKGNWWKAASCSATCGSPRGSLRRKTPSSNASCNGGTPRPAGRQNEHHDGQIQLGQLGFDGRHGAGTANLDHSRWWLGGRLAADSPAEINSSRLALTD